MTKYLDSAPFLIPAPSKEFRPEHPTNLYADKFPDLVDKPEPPIAQEIIDAMMENMQAVTGVCLDLKLDTPGARTATVARIMAEEES